MAAIPRTKQTHLAWRQGDTAHLDAQPDLDNPYDPSTDSYRAWQRGWHGDPFDERGGFEATGETHIDIEEVAA
jgi:hypothetical protein